MVVVPFPGELRTGRTIARAVTDVELARQRAEGDLFSGRVSERQMRLRDEIEEVAVPDIHLDDAPAAGKGFGDGSPWPSAGLRQELRQAH